MNEKLRDPQLDTLFQAILNLKDVEECYRFFDDLCTVNELRAMEQRFHVARMLARGSIYSDIVAATGASTATISRVNRCLNYGNDGYRDAIERLKENESL